MEVAEAAAAAGGVNGATGAGGDAADGTNASDGANGAKGVGRASGAGGATGAGGVEGGIDGRALEIDVTHIVDLYREAGRKMRAGDPADWASHLSMPQLRVLFYLGRYGPLSVGEVAAGVGVAQPSATETLDKLVRSGLVGRAPDCNDRRVVRNTLTPAGRDMIERPWEARRAVLASALRDAPPHDRAAIAQGLALLCAALERSAGLADVASEEDPADEAGEAGKKVEEEGRNTR